MTNYHPADVVLVPFPFADLSTTKKRPALVLASLLPEKLVPLIIVAMITSQVDSEMIPGDFILEEWEAAGLLHPSKVRLGKVVSLEANMVVEKIGSLKKGDWLHAGREFLGLFFFHQQ